MKPMKYMLLSCAVIISAGILCGAGGGADDPLVTKSWVDDYVESSFLKMEKQIAQAKSDIASGGYDIKLWIGNKQAQVGGKTVTLDVAPVIKDGRTMVPLAFVSQSLGATVNWDNTKKEVSYKKGDTKVRMIVGQKSATINEKAVAMDAAVYVENGRTMVPLAFIANALSAKTQWDNTTKMITIR
ncbi:MAG: copper amine oxidase N-terminal domain-containing protein [Peptococcaceae bacterium]|nr:copper amine oxidase N-terminal domain-containing protein [Peptococcaceae bacterium]